MLLFRNHYFLTIFLEAILHLHVTLAILFSSPSPPPLSLYLPLFPPLFPSSHFPNVALSNHKPLPLKSSDPLVFLLHSIHRKEEELLTMQQITILVPPTVPCILIYIKAGHFKGYKETKERITGERSKAEVDYEDKGYVMVVKTPRCPCFEILHPTTCSNSNKFWIYLLVASQSLWESVSRIWCRNKQPTLVDERGHVYFNLALFFLWNHCEGQQMAFLPAFDENARQVMDNALNYATMFLFFTSLNHSYLPSALLAVMLISKKKNN